MENQKLNCPGCEAEIYKEFHDFVDVSIDPEYKAQILSGEFFLAKCKECGCETLIEYPMLYMDPEKKLNIYLAPEHDPDLLDQLNSLDIPDADVDHESVFRLVENGAELIEKILIAEGGRDDRILELYKVVVIENLKEDIPEIEGQDLLYYYENGEDYLVFWDFTNHEGDQLTVDIEPELYQDLMDTYLKDLQIPAGKYANVGKSWLEDMLNER